MLHSNTPRHAFAMREHWSSVAPSAGSAQGFCASGCGCHRGRYSSGSHSRSPCCSCARAVERCAPALSSLGGSSAPTRALTSSNSAAACFAPTGPASSSCAASIEVRKRAASSATSAAVAPRSAAAVAAASAGGTPDDAVGTPASAARRVAAHAASVALRGSWSISAATALRSRRGRRPARPEMASRAPCGLKESSHRSPARAARAPSAASACNRM